MTTAEGIKVFRKDIQLFLKDLDTHNTYRERLVIPKALYKGLVWGMFWSATRILGPEDKDTVRRNLAGNLRLPEMFGLTSLCFVVAYLIMPRAWTVISEGQFKPWDFSLMPTLFVLIDVLLWGTFFYLCKLIVRLLIRRRRLSKLLSVNP